jgi:glycosyltransferase involved in cell wall biosynthesis
MTELSVIIPARNEEFLQQTIDNVLENIEADTEIVVVLDGYWPERGIPQNERVTVIHHEESIGQRAATNEGAKFSNAKFVMKLDAHCAVDKGFDKKLMADCKYTDTIVPAMYNLHAFDWQCPKCGMRVYQGPVPSKCHECGNTKGFEKKIVWKAKPNPRSEFYYFDTDMKFQYWRAFKKRPEAKGDLAPTMGNLGACFFIHRERFLDLGGMDEKHGGWGQFGTEISCKSWLSGGRQMVNKKTWFSHMFRTGNGFGFPYQISGRQVRAARKYSQNLWLNDSWPQAKHSLKWLIEKFSPVPTWDPDKIKALGGGRRDRGVLTKNLVKGCVYYTNNKVSNKIFNAVQQQLSLFKGPIVSVSHKPVDFGTNIVVNLQSSVLSMFKQILIGLENSKADIIFLTEHDVLYHPSHFEFTPVKKDLFYYNVNTWKVDAKTGQALFYYTKQVSGLCGYREFMIEHYKKRVERVEKEGFTRRMGFEPGTWKFPRGVDNTESRTYMSKIANIDIRHDNNQTANRFKKELFRNKRSTLGWRLADAVPGWGRTKERFDEWLKNLSDSLSESKNKNEWLKKQKTLLKKQKAANTVGN